MECKERPECVFGRDYYYAVSECLGRTFSCVFFFFLFLFLETTMFNLRISFLGDLASQTYVRSTFSWAEPEVCDRSRWAGSPGKEINSEKLFPNMGKRRFDDVIRMTRSESFSSFKTESLIIVIMMMSLLRYQIRSDFRLRFFFNFFLCASCEVSSLQSLPDGKSAKFCFAPMRTVRLSKVL